MADSAHFDRMLRWIDLEARAEEAQLLDEIRRAEDSGGDPEQSGITLRALVIREETTGLGGRVLLKLGKRNQTKVLPWNRLTSGTPILLTEEHVTKAETWRGVVSQQTREHLQIALDQYPEAIEDRPTFRLDLASDEIMRQRTRQALERIRNHREGRLVDLRAILLGEELPVYREILSFDPVNVMLDHSQREAVAFALSAEDLAIIHGPPGTGKTTTVVEFIQQSVLRGERVLACAPSNMGVDNIFERLLAGGIRAVRIGHPARVSPALRDNTLDELVENHPDFLLSKKLIRDAHALRARADRFTRARPAPGEKRWLRDEAADMLREANLLEKSLVERILTQAQVICSTTTGLNPQVLGDLTFDVCVIDEAAQSTEPGCWLPLLYSNRLILAGDHQQLPPTIISTEAARQGFGVSMMERLMQHHTGDGNRQIARQLTVQYRMHQDIMTFSSRYFYDGSLEAHATVAAHSLADLPGVDQNTLQTDGWVTMPVQFIDTAGAGYEEEQEAGGESKLNRQEASLVVKKVTELIQAGLSAIHIGVITPYSAQVRLLRSMLPEEIEVNSVDGFQGREKEVIIISLVRSNDRGEIGFLADERRMNVAMTRARRKLLLIGDSATISSTDEKSFYQQMLDYFDEVQAYRSVWEEI